MNKKALNALKYIISLVLAGVLAYFAIRKVDWAAFISGLEDTRWCFILLFLLASVMAIVFRNERWRLIMISLDPQVKRLDSWDATNIGNVANLAIPGAGEFLRCGYMSSHRMNYETTFGTMVCERAWDMLAVLLLVLGSLAAKWESFGSFFKEKVLGAANEGFSIGLIILLSVALALGAGSLMLVYKLRKRNNICERIASAVDGLWKGIISFAHIRSKALFILYTAGIWFSYILMTYFVLLAMPALEHLSLTDAVLISAMGNIASVIPVPGGIGAYHYIVALTLQSLYGAGWETGLLFATLNHELHALLVIVLGVISYIRLSSSRRKKNATDHTE